VAWTKTRRYPMKKHLSPTLGLIFAFCFFLFIPQMAKAATPPAPSLLSPASGASVSAPLAISWSAVTDPSGIIAYNWQVSTSSTFSTITANNSTMGPTQDTVSGLGNGTYFWRVQSVNSNFVQSAWSAARSFSMNNIPDPTYSFSTPNEGNYFARVFAVDSNGVRSAPSNVITFSIFYSN